MSTFVISKFESSYHNKNQFQEGVEIEEDGHTTRYILLERQNNKVVESKKEEDLKQEVIEYLARKCKTGDKVVLRSQRELNMKGMGIVQVMIPPPIELFGYQQFIRQFFKVKNS